MENEKDYFEKNFKDKLAYLIDKKQQHTPSRSKNYFHITHSEIAEDLKISRQTLINYGNGTSTPTFGILKRMADYFEVDINFFMEDEEKLSKNNVNINDILSEKAIMNLIRYKKSKNPKDNEKIKLINKLLEDKQMIDALISIINSK